MFSGALSMLVVQDRDKRVWRRLQTDAETGCWLWTGAKTPAGYGQVHINGRRHYVHRLVYEWFYAPIPNERQLDHLCRVRNCANPKHLEVVTLGENVRRGTGVTALNARASQCKRGHLFDTANTYMYRGQRHCKECKRRLTREWRARRKQATL